MNHPQGPSRPRVEGCAGTKTGYAWGVTATLSSQLLGRDRTILLVRLPLTVVDEQVQPIRDEARSRMPRIPGAGLILDFGNVELINSIGITCLLQVDEDCRKAGGVMRMTGLSPAIAQFLKQLKLDRRFVIRATAEDAVAELDSGSK